MFVQVILSLLQNVWLEFFEMLSLSIFTVNGCCSVGLLRSCSLNLTRNIIEMGRAPRPRSRRQSRSCDGRTRNRRSCRGQSRSTVRGGYCMTNFLLDETCHESTFLAELKYVCRDPYCCFNSSRWGGPKGMRNHQADVHHVTDFRNMQQMCTNTRFCGHKIHMPNLHLSFREACSSAAWKVHSLSSLYVISDDEAVELFLRYVIPTRTCPYHTNKEKILERLLQIQVKFFYPVVRRARGNYGQCGFCHEWECHPGSSLCMNHMDIFKLKELYPSQPLLGTAEEQKKSKFHFWLSTKGGFRHPVHLEYNSGVSSHNFYMDVQRLELRKAMRLTTQHLINILSSKRILKGGESWLTFT